MKPKLSIVIPVYNVEKLLRSCLDSILCQDCKQVEVVLVDDGSCDGSRSICEDYAAKYANGNFVHQENGGVSSARNKGLDVACGEYISFVDSDDRVEPSYIKTLLDAACDNIISADITFFGVTIVYQNGRTEKVVQQEEFFSGRDALEKGVLLLRYAGERDVFGWTCDKVFRADIIRNNKVRFREDIGFREDEIFTFEYCRYAQSLSVLSVALYIYQLNDSGLTARNINPSDYLPSSIQLEESMAFFKDEAVCEHMLHSITSYRALHIFKQCSFSEVKSALGEYKKLIQRHPQPGKLCPISHLTQYLKRGFWTAYLYCLIRRF